MRHSTICLVLLVLTRFSGVASAILATVPVGDAQLNLSSWVLLKDIPMPDSNATDLRGLERRRHYFTVVDPDWEDYVTAADALPPHDGDEPSEHGGHDAAEHGGHDATEHGGHETEDSGHGVGHENKESRSVAVGLVAAVVLTPIGMHMLLSSGVKKYIMLKMLDQCMAIFVAVLWFTVYSAFIQTFKVYDYIPLSVELISFAQVFLLEVFFLFCANHMSHPGSSIWPASPRSQTAQSLGPGTICSLGAHYVAFTAIGAGGHLQKSAAENVVDGWKFSIMVTLVIMLGLLVVGGLIEFCVIGRYTSYSEEWNNTTGVQIDEMQMEVLGLVGSFLIIQAVRHGITGRYPPLTLGGPTEDDGGGHSAHDDFTHTGWQRSFMFLWSIGFSLVAMYAVPKLNLMSGDSRNIRKVVHGLKVLLIMLVAWGYLLWGEWLFYEELFHGDVMFGHMVFALIATSISFAFVFCMSGAIEKNSLHNETARGAIESARGRRRSIPGRTEAVASVASSIKQSHGVTITGVSLLTAWSWEHCFHIAFGIIGEHYQMGYNGLVPKTCLAILIPAVLLPVYVLHVKPRVLEEERTNDPEADIVV